MVGRLCKQKNQSMGIKIFNEIDNSYLDLLIVGDGPDKIKLEQLIKQYHLEKRAFIISYQENIYDWIANAKLLLSTSVFEGFSIVLVEALTLNTPAISSNCPFGPSEILTSELTDYLIPLSADKKIWKCKIDNILKNKYPKISEKYTEKFNPQTIIDQYINYYER